MLKKLIKYEWKSVSKVSGIMLLAILLVTLIGSIVVGMPWMKNWMENESYFNELQSVGMVYMLLISFFLYVFMLVGITYGIVIYLGVHFYKTMYTDQGYLTNTLPVTPNQILISKVFVSGLWYLLIEAAVVLSVFVLVGSMMSGALNSEGYTLMEAIAMIWDEMQYVFHSEFGMTMVRFGLFIMFVAIIGPFCTMIMLFGAITIGQLSKRYKALMGILAYFGIAVVNMIISMIVQMIYTMNTMKSLANPSGLTEMTYNMTGMYDMSLLILIIMSLLLYWVAHTILSKKLNMD